jgi:hypothetical protein
MANQLSIREQLEKCWSFADNYKWLAIASNLNSEDPISGELKPSYPKPLDVQVSYSFFVRHNNWLLLIINQGWRHEYNIALRRFSCLISNSEVFLTNPQDYQRLFVQGELRSYQQDSSIYQKFLRPYLEVFSPEKNVSGKVYNPMLVNKGHCLAILKPDLVEYSIRTEPISEKGDYEEIRDSIQLSGINFDEDGNLISL